MEQTEQPILSYCEYIKNMQSGESKDLNQAYHDKQYGFPLHNDNELFGRLILEINQAGLSWTTILKKQQNFRTAFDNFDIEKIANYGETDRMRLLADRGIIRNKLKIDAVIYNAKAIVVLQKEYGSFENWLNSNDLQTKDEWVKLFKKHFKFVGGEIVNEFLISVGYLKGAHQQSCPIYDKIIKANPKWKQRESNVENCRVK